MEVLQQVELIGGWLDISASGTRKQEDSYLREVRNGQQSKKKHSLQPANFLWKETGTFPCIKGLHKSSCERDQNYIVGNSSKPIKT